MQHTNLTTARKLKVDEKIDKLGKNSDATSFTGIRRELSLNKSKIKPVALSFIEPYSDQFVLQSSIPTIYSRPFWHREFKPVIYWLTKKICVTVEICLSSEAILQIEKDTQGSVFFWHRARHIGASVSGAVCQTNLSQPSQTLIKSICYPNLF